MIESSYSQEGQGNRVERLDFKPGERGKKGERPNFGPKARILDERYKAQLKPCPLASSETDRVPQCLKKPQNARPILVLALFVGFDQLRDFGTGSYRFDEDDVALVQKHAIGTVPLIAAAHQNAGHGLGLLVDLALDVIHIGQLRKICTGIRELAIVKLPVVQQDSGVRRGNLRSFVPSASFTSG